MLPIEILIITCTVVGIANYLAYKYIPSVHEWYEKTLKEEE